MLMKWHIVSSETYFGGTPVANDMYFLSDTKEIYRGSDLFSQAVDVVSAFPTTSIKRNHLYIKSDTLEGKIYNGTSWVQVIKPVSSTVVANGTDPVNSSAVIAYVSAQIAEAVASPDLIKGLDWDGDEHTLEITTADDESESVVLTGLGVDLSYNSSTGALQLKDANGTLIGNPISLDLERFVNSCVYDAATETIILTFNDDETVSIPVGSLIDEYDVTNSDAAITLTLNKTSNVLSAAINISSATGNILEKKTDGLYVPLTDLSGKMDKDTDAVEDNIAVFDDEGNAVDSGKAFSDLLPNNHVYEGATLSAAVGANTPIKGDVAIVSAAIGDTEFVEKTVYQYDGTNWKQFDAKYNAENVLFAEDLVTTVKIGNIQTLTNGQAIVAEAGESVKDALNKILMKETNPTITQPAVSFATASANKFTAYEVGTSVDLTDVTANLSGGTYSYGSKDSSGNKITSTGAGVTATKWKFTDGAAVKDNLSVNKATFDSVQVADNTDYKITATATYGDSPYTPITNAGNLYASGKITGGTKSATTNAITGYRNSFYGTVTNKNALTSTIVRGLTKSNKALKAGDKFDVTIPAGAMRVVIAIPASVSGVGDLPASVIDENGMKAEVKTGFTLSTLNVEGANGYTAVSYKIWTLDYANAVTDANVYHVTL